MRESTRRRNVFTGGLVVALVVTLVLAGIAYWGWDEAARERDHATRNFNVAQQAAESLVFDIAQHRLFVADGTTLPVSLSGTYREIAVDI